MYGAENVLLNLLVGLKKAGHTPLLGSIRLPGEPKKQIEVAVESLGIEVWPVTARRGFDRSAARLLAKRARTEQVSVIHCHGYKANILTALFARSVFRGAIVTTLHGWTATRISQPRWWYGLLDRQLLRFFDAIAAVQPGMLLDTRIPLGVRRRLVQIDNGIDTSPNEPSAPPADLLTFCQQGETIGVVGRLSAEKGVDVLLDAFALLATNRTAPRVAIIGDGPLRSALESKADALGIRSRVCFAGFVSAATAVLPALKCLAIPSHTEGLPMVLLEAMRAQVPIVATRVGGIPTALQDGACGYLVAPNDPRQLSEALLSALDNDSETSSRVVAAFKRLHERYSAQAMVDRYLNLYSTARKQREQR